MVFMNIRLLLASKAFGNDWIFDPKSTIFPIPKFDQEISQKFLDRIGKYKAGVSCVYINKLADIDEGVLREFIREGFQYMQSHFKTIDRL